MAKCEVCGNDYDKSFEVTFGGKRHVFDSFECAIHALAPKCAHCGCSIIGHGVEGNGRIFCCVHCARESGQAGLKDRA
jgi:nitrite reductase/ring-hydroxylating ferredoxin subunit